MTEANLDGILRKVQALLDKAESTTFPAEREAYRAKADSMMAKYSIEAFELEQARRAKGEAASLKPVVVDINLPATRGQADGQGSFNNYSNFLLHTIANALSCRVIHKGWRRDDEHGSHYAFQIVGFEADVKYLEMLFVRLRLEMVGALNPVVNPELGYDANVFSLHEAGIKWREIARLMNQHVKRQDGHAYSALDERIGDQVAVGPWEFTPYPDGGRLIRAYKRHCKVQGVEPIAVPVSINYQEDWNQAFRDRIATRLRRAQDEANAGALVLRSKQAEVDLLWDNLTYVFNPIKRTPAKPGKAVRVRKQRYRAFDANAAAAGARAAERVSLGRPGSEVKNGDAGQIGR